MGSNSVGIGVDEMRGRVGSIGNGDMFGKVTRGED